MRVIYFLFLAAITLHNTCEAQSHPATFKKQVVFTKPADYISEGVAIADVNKDGKKDLMAGTFWFEAPSWKMHEITDPEIHTIEGYGNSFLNFSLDVNQDGWQDMVLLGFPGNEALWYENPKNIPGHWKRHVIYHSVGNESPAFADVDGDGKPDIICNDSKEKKVIWISPPINKGDTNWTAYTISSDTLIATHMFTHGLGYGDINGDGRKDVVVRSGWWEAPEDRKQPNWKYHPADLGEECSQMYVLDLDGDGDSDVISASAHQYGIWWHEQIQTADSKAWKTHEIFKEFSQTHGMALADINGDGQPDLITGKRFWAHMGHDPGEREPRVIYWFEFKPGKEPKWIPHLIDNDSGVGLHIPVEDMNGDNLPDIAISNKKGVFLFTQIKK